VNAAAFCTAETDEEPEIEEEKTREERRWIH
jgi:hypothetical protein